MGEFRPDHVLIALAAQRVYAQPPHTDGSGQQYQSECHALHDAGDTGMAGQRVGFGEPPTHFVRRQHVDDRVSGSVRSRGSQRFGRGVLLQHIRGLLRISDDGLEFVGHTHREYATHVISKRNVRSRTYRAAYTKTSTYPEEATYPCCIPALGELGDIPPRGGKDQCTPCPDQRPYMRIFR